MTRPLFVHQVEFEVAPGKLPEWRSYIPGYLGAQSRMPGSVSFRVLEDKGTPNRFFSIRTWLSKEDAMRAKESPESQLAGQPARDGGFYDGMPVRHEEFELLDMVWGLEGPTAFATQGLAAQHIVTGPGPGLYDLWRPYARNFASVMARQTGLVCHETYRSLADPERIVVLRTFRSTDAANAGPEYAPPKEVKLAAKPAKDLGVYEGHVPAVRTECELFDAVWGQAGQAAYDRFIMDLEPV